MGRTALLQEIRKMRFEQTYEGWQAGRLTQARAAQILGMCDRQLSAHHGTLRGRRRSRAH